MQAFRILVERYQSMLFSLACRFLGKDEAEDVVQEVFIRLWRNFHRYKPNIKLTTWLYRIATNLCLDYLKSRHYKSSFNSIEICETHAIPDSATPDKKLENHELMQFILKIANSLTPRQRAVFVLRDLEGLSSKEVCEILSMKPGNVKSNLYYARLKMSEKLSQHYNLTEKRLL